MTMQENLDWNCHLSTQLAIWEVDWRNCSCGTALLPW